MSNFVGRIRPGVKVLKKSITDPKAQEIVERGIRAGVGFPAIDSALNKAGFRHALIPKNEPFFSVWPGEWQNKETAHQILELYGEQREGDPVKRLYEFPVIFPHSDPNRMIFTRMESYTAKGLKYHSEVRNGETLCIGKAEVPKRTDGSGKAIRIFGGRKEQIRGVCDPEHCPEYQDKACNRRSHILVAIPGATMAAEFVEIPTGSFYAVDDIEKTLQRTAEVCGGKIPLEVQMGWKDYPIFWMTKVRDKVSHVTDEGDQEMVPQILAHLNCKIELAHLLSLADTVANKYQRLSTSLLPDKVLAAQRQNAAMLEHQHIARPEEFMSNAPQHQEKVPVQETAMSSASVPAQHVTPIHGPSETTSTDQPEQLTPAPQDNPGPVDVAPTSEKPMNGTPEEIDHLRKKTAALCKQVGINPVQYLEYGNARFGTNWGKNLGCLQAALQELQQALDSGDLEGYIAEVNNVIYEEKQRNTESA